LQIRFAAGRLQEVEPIAFEIVNFVFMTSKSSYSEVSGANGLRLNTRSLMTVNGFRISWAMPWQTRPRSSFPAFNDGRLAVTSAGGGLIRRAIDQYQHARRASNPHRDRRWKRSAGSTRR
jgi:hypothetical protein